MNDDDRTQELVDFVNDSFEQEKEVRRKLRNKRKAQKKKFKK